jgi:hypothetical protein
MLVSFFLSYITVALLFFSNFSRVSSTPLLLWAPQLATSHMHPQYAGFSIPFGMDSGCSIAICSPLYSKRAWNLAFHIDHFSPLNCGIETLSTNNYPESLRRKET